MRLPSHPRGRRRSGCCPRPRGSTVPSRRCCATRWSGWPARSARARRRPRRGMVRATGSSPDCRSERHQRRRPPTAGCSASRCCASRCQHQLQVLARHRESDRHLLAARRRTAAGARRHAGTLGRSSCQPQDEARGALAHLGLEVLEQLPRLRDQIGRPAVRHQDHAGDQPILIGRAEDSTLVLDDDYAVHPARPAHPAGPVVLRGPRLDQRHLPRPSQRHPRPRSRSGCRSGSAGPSSSCAHDPQLAYAPAVDRGLIRSSNQDSVYAGPRLLVVADGMGGHAAGEVASTVVVAAFVHARRRRARRRPARARCARPPATATTHRRGGARGPRARRHGHHPHRAAVRRRPARPGARRRLPRLPVPRRRAHQITHDDTFVQSLIDDGRITQEEATTTRSARCCCARSTAPRSSPTCPSARSGPATAT